MNLSSKFFILPPIVAGVVVLFLAQSGRTAPTLADNQERSQMVRVLDLKKQDFTPIAKGYGTVRAAQTWKAISQVSARIIKVHPNLSDGAYIKKDEILVELDPIDYELNLAQAKVKLAEIQVTEKNTKASLAIEQRNLALAEKEYKRLKSLASKGTTSKSSADASERAMLSSRSAVQNFKNSLALLPSQKKIQQSKIKQAQRDLDNTKIKAPFNMNVTGLDVETNQFVSKGQQMFSGNSIDRVEIVTYVPISELKNLFFQRDIDANIESLAGNISSLANFSPTVFLDIGNEQKAAWEAEFVHFADEIDVATRTMGLVIAVANPLQKIEVGVRPVLSKGMFVEVDIAGQVQKDMIAIPRSSIHKGSVYLMGEDNRLKVQQITPLYHQGSQTIVKDGLSGDERLVLSDLIPAVDGMLLKTENAQ